MHGDIFPMNSKELERHSSSNDKHTQHILVISELTMGHTQ